MKKSDNYFKIVKDRRDYKGDRYFKLDWNTDKCVQVVKSTGAEAKGGRAHSFGVYLIGKMTMVANYLGPGYAIPCTKAEYEKAKEFVIAALK